MSRSVSGNEWDAERYDRNARFVSDLGAPVMELLAPLEGERILDLGCGDGVLTRKLMGLGALVKGLDAAASMVAAARALGVDAVEGDMHVFDLGERFDAVFSNAVLHWTRDIDAVLGCVGRHLRPGGRFVGEFGGFGNVAAIATAMRAARRLAGVEDNAFAWYYPTAEEFQQRLEAAGFQVERIELIPRPTPLVVGMGGWLRTFATPFVAQASEEKREEVLALALELLRPALCDGAGNWTADYVRLRFRARAAALDSLGSQIA